MRPLARGVLLVGVAAMLTSARPPLGQTARNRAIMTEFVRVFYGERDVRRAFDRFVAPDYIQHNPDIPDGLEAAVRALLPIFSPSGARFEVKRVLVDGDMAIVHLLGRSDPRQPGAAVADLYRLHDGRIVEHWDVLQPIAAKTTNPHPYF